MGRGVMFKDITSLNFIHFEWLKAAYLTRDVKEAKIVSLKQTLKES